MTMHYGSKGHDADFDFFAARTAHWHGANASGIFWTVPSR